MTSFLKDDLDSICDLLRAIITNWTEQARRCFDVRRCVQRTFRIRGDAFFALMPFLFVGNVFFLNVEIF